MESIRRIFHHLEQLRDKQNVSGEQDRSITSGSWRPFNSIPEMSRTSVLHGMVALKSHLVHKTHSFADLLLMYVYSEHKTPIPFDEWDLKQVLCFSRAFPTIYPHKQ